jgi:hypothetical protein
LPSELVSNDEQGHMLVGGHQELGGYTRMIRLKFELWKGERAEVHVEIDMDYEESEALESEGEHQFVCCLLPFADMGG